MLWISNVYPEAYDDKCLPWTWFMPAYIQLSLLLPLIVGIYVAFSNKLFAGIIYTFIGLGSLLATMTFVIEEDVGGSMIYNEKFYNTVFMNPLFHFSSFFIGICTCLIYMRFMEDRSHAEEHGNSNSSRILEYIASNSCFRYPIYLICLGAMLVTVLW